MKETDRKRFLFLANKIPNDVFTVLDCGAREGHFGNLLKERGFKVVSIDIEPLNGGVLKGDISCLPFEDKTFDLVTALEVLEHLPDEILSFALVEIKRVSKRYVIVSVPNDEYPITCTDHTQTFSEKRLCRLFGGSKSFWFVHKRTFREKLWIAKMTLVETWKKWREGYNWISALYDLEENEAEK